MQESDPDEMLPEYNFSNAERGKHYQAYRAGHTVRVFKTDGSVQETHFTLADGAVMIDPDLHAKFPTSEAVNAALRSLVSS